MIYETALIWIVISAGYWGVFLLRRGTYTTVTFPVMMIAAAVLSGLGLLEPDGASRPLAFAGAIGLGAGSCLLVIGPLVRRLARRANNSEYWSLSRWLYEIADVLQPGTGVREEKRLAAAFADIHAGQVDQAVSALQQVRNRVPRQAHRAIDEHITMIYMTAWRWAQAIAYAESTLLRTASAPVDHRAQLREVSASLWVELIAAYGRVGDLAQAAAMLEAFEAEVGDQTRAAPLLHRARLVFLAMCGQLEPVRALASRGNASHMRKAARNYWIGIAAERSGDRTLAVSSLRQAVAGSRGRARRMASAALQDCEKSPLVELSADVVAIAEQVALRPVPAWTVAPAPWFSWLSCGMCIAVAVAVSISGDSTDVSTLVRAGAVVRGLVDDGQWWRLATAVFVHVGPVHVVVNVMGLWVLGHLAEDVFGKLRTASLFALCGVVGATASYLGSSAGISAGASGAVFGLLGAVLGELTMHRGHFILAIRNGMWGALLVVAVATLAAGSQIPEIDQWAHVGGLICGLVVGQAVSERHRVGRRAAWVAWPVVAGFIALLLWGAWSISQRDFATLMMGGPRTTAQVEELRFEVPERWKPMDGEFVDPDIYVVLSVRAIPAGAADAVSVIDTGEPTSSSQWFAGEPTRARERNFSTATFAAVKLVPLSNGWQSRELELTATGALAGQQRFRVVSFARTEGKRLILGSLYAPQSLVETAGAELAQVITSIRASR
jgi:membrane associated rhomboid family serine protease